MTVFTFQERFHEAVRTGAKLTTIRATRRRLPKPGQAVSLRRWTGKPYRSKQEKLRHDSILVRVSEVTIALRGPVTPGNHRHAWNWVPRIWVEGHYYEEGEEREALARADGFESFEEMLPFFVTPRKPNFTGHLYQWADLALTPTDIK